MIQSWFLYKLTKNFSNYILCDILYAINISLNIYFVDKYHKIDYTIIERMIKISKFQTFLDDNLKNINLKDLPKDDSYVRSYDIYKEISDSIVKLRIQAGLTQKQLAEISGLTQSNISNIEKGNKHPTIESLKKIADATGKRLIIDFKDNEVNL